VDFARRPEAGRKGVFWRGSSSDARLHAQILFPDAPVIGGSFFHNRDGFVVTA